MSQPGICSFCFKNIVCATAGWGFHHPSYSSLTKSARQRCAFCTLLHADVRKHQGSIRKFDLASPVANHTTRNWLDDINTTDTVSAVPESSTSLYRWSIRSLGRTSETNLTVAITFRVVPQLLPEDKENATTADARLQTFGLPERVFYCFLENDLGALLSQAKLGTSTNPDINEGHQIKSWIRTCGIEHKHCPKRLGAGTKFVPTRLLHVGRGRKGDPVRVVDTKASKVKGPYVTLSHCWGEDEGVRRDTLTSKNYVEFHEQGVPWSYLSRTFKEAIEVARFLEVDYLWIDSLCIIQGNDKVSREDWEREGSLMHRVYRASYCNIAAADAPNSKRGLFRNRKAHDVFSAKFESDGTSPMFGERVWRAVREDLWDDGLLQRPLYKRGWVFQERMLAPRIIHFSQHQIFWDCAAMSACETLPEGLPLPLDRESATDRHWRGRLQEAGTNQAILMTAANDDAIENFWKMAVENYTSLNLTFQTDKRRALWGIAKLVRDGLNQDYAVGMWGQDLEEQLAWRVADYTVAERPRELTINPSWAWPSVKGTILVGESTVQERIYKVTNPEGQPLAFKTMNQVTRPSLGREPSETFEEEVAAMSRDLQLVDERRRQSSASSRHNSQINSFSSRHNSQVDAWSSWSQPMDKLQDPRTEGTIISAMTTMSPQQTIVDPDEDSENVQRSEYTTRQNSVASSLKTQDMEPELAEHRIPILGYRRQGILRLESTHGRWTIDLSSDNQLDHDEFLVEAYPDVKPEANSQAINFVVLVLSELAEDNSPLYYGQVSAPTQKTWLEGHGIMLHPTEVDNCYTRLGSLKIRRLSPRIWNSIKNNEGAYDSSRIEDAKVVPDVFYLV